MMMLITFTVRCLRGKKIFLITFVHPDLTTLPGSSQQLKAEQFSSRIWGSRTRTQAPQTK
jgi:hypothetical protein